MSTNSQIDSAAVEEERRKYRYRAGAFLGLVGGVAALFGFSRTLGRAKREEAAFIAKGGRETLILMDAGSSLALRALGWGTLYAFLGTGAFCYGVWKLSGATNMEEFRKKMGSGLPRLTKTDPPTSRTEFDGLTDLMKYLAAWGKE